VESEPVPAELYPTDMEMALAKVLLELVAFSTNFFSF
jgi:hypothetical protein